MLDLTTYRKSVEKYLGDNFTACPIRQENVGLPKESQTWISINDKQALSTPTGMAEDTMIIDGNLIIGIFVPRNTGTAAARTIAESLSDLLGNKTIDGVAFQEPVFHGSPGGDPEIAWYQMNLVIPYRAVFGQNYVDC